MSSKTDTASSSPGHLKEVQKLILPQASFSAHSHMVKGLPSKEAHAHEYFLSFSACLFLAKSSAILSAS
jgi:hypothetical protein